MPAVGEDIRALFGSLSLPASEADAELTLLAFRQRSAPRIISFLNAHAVNLAVRDPRFDEALRESDLLLRDGIGVRIGCALMGLKPGPNMNGTDLIPGLIADYYGKRIALLGAEPQWLEQAARVLRAAGHKDLVTLDGFQETSAYVARVIQTKPALVVLAMGMPKQEIVAVAIREAAKAADLGLLIVNGGAIVDFIAGKVKRAPAWMRKAGLEWVFRLMLEPARLAPRYLFGNPIFLWRVALMRWRSGPVSRRLRPNGPAAPQ